MKHLLFAVIIVLIATVSALAAGPQKYTFDPVTFPDETSGIIEATSKTGGNPYTTCRYFGPAYVEYLGRYDEAVGFSEAEDVKQHCLDNYDNRE